MKKTKHLPEEKKAEFVPKREMMQYEFERMRKSSERPTYPNRGEDPWLKEPEPSA